MYLAFLFQTNLEPHDLHVFDCNTYTRNCKMIMKIVSSCTIKLQVNEWKKDPDHRKLRIVAC